MNLLEKSSVVAHPDLLRPRTVKKVPFVELYSGRLQGVISSGSDENRVYVAHPNWRANIGRSHDSVWSGSVDPKFSEWFFTKVTEMKFGKLSWIDNMADYLTTRKRLKRKTVVSFRSVAVSPEIRWTVAIEGHELASGRR